MKLISNIWPFGVTPFQSTRLMKESRQLHEHDSGGGGGEARVNRPTCHHVGLSHTKRYGTTDGLAALRRVAASHARAGGTTESRHNAWHD
jgi:hypothetical protein